MKVVIKCMNAAHGCPLEDELDIIAIHEKICLWRVVHCPSNSCRWLGSLPRLTLHNRETNCFYQLVHVRDNGSLFTGNIRDFTESGQSVFDRKLITHWQPTMLVSPAWQEYSFHLTVHRSAKGLWYIMVRSLLPGFKLRLIQVRLVLYNSDEEIHQGHTYDGKVIPSILSDEEIVASGNFMMLRDSQIKRLSTNDIISRYKINIYRLRPNSRIEEAGLQDERPVRNPLGG